MDFYAIFGTPPQLCPSEPPGCILRSPAATVAVCERPDCGINGRMFIRKFSSGG